ncbi:plant UBX domain-containing protein 4 [Cajanus cajan]|uniref:UBA and UBX domain-containing protein At4g15410 family n=1 Tax=Cajanus cajan TaxID=3821 RepID=A0A151TVD5_CAJCA|nr:plant UBX domain-containing protein 4 [Cajanus cajan]KYP71032.1 UBA and UBX domain-containing protein At4g15410 family [Cajanus cajan]
MEGENEKHDGNAALVNSFCEITSSSKQEALFFLESHNFDLDAAVLTFLDNNNNNNAPIPQNDNVAPNPTVDSPSPDFQPSPSLSPSPSPSRTPYELRSRRSLAKKPSGSRHAKVRTLGDLKRTSRPDSDSDSDPDFEPDEYYTGGEKSGMVVGDPSKGGNSVDDIFEQAREVAVEAPSNSSTRSRSFSGTARLLSGETLPSAPRPVQELTHTVTFWRNGFSVNDGPLRTLDDPLNAPFLESIKKSECPKELEPADRRTSVHVNLTRRDEDYPEPVKPRHLAFHGVGRTLGSTSSSSDEPIQTTAASPNTAPLPTLGLIIDEAQPVTSIQLRLADGTRMVSRFNHHHTIRDVRAFIDASRPGGARSYQLQTMGFPPKQLADLDQTIEQAGIANSVVIQKL